MMRIVSTTRWKRCPSQKNPERDRPLRKIRAEIPVRNSATSRLAMMEMRTGARAGVNSERLLAMG